MVVIIMGVAGCGKSTLGALVSREKNCPFIEGDDFHPRENIEKMSQGIPLEDEDRQEWLKALRARVEEYLANRKDAVLACSALKKSYREILKKTGEPVHLVYLKGDKEVIARRLKKRKGHFMPPALLESQFKTLEEPEDALVLDLQNPPETLARKVLALFPDCQKGE